MNFDHSITTENQESSLFEFECNGCKYQTPHIESPLKKLFYATLSSGRDIDLYVPKCKDKLLLHVRQSFPQFLVSDGHFFTKIEFSQKCIDTFRKSFPNRHIVDLESRTIKINSLSLKLKGEDEVFTTMFSFAGIQV